MNEDPLRGKTLRWTFDDGPMTGVTYEHAFRDDGTVTWAEPGKAPDEGSRAKYHAERVGGVIAVSYLSKSGHTLTTLLDEKTGKIVSFASNEKSHVTQHGTSKEM